MSEWSEQQVRYIEKCQERGNDAEVLATVRLIVERLSVVPTTEQKTATLVMAGDWLNGLIKMAQNLLADYVIPNSGVTEAKLISVLLGVFDGPDQREAQAAWERVRKL